MAEGETETAAPVAPTTARRQFVWDFPTRIFHWALVGLIGFSWWSAENHEMDWHLWSGIVVVGLVVFRILWGLFGTSTSRFAQFVKGPRAIFAYLKPDPLAPKPAPLGHNPLGAWSVIALLLVLLVQVGTGLFASDIDMLYSGQLSYAVSFDQSRVFAEIHEISFKVLQVLVLLHLLAILYYLFFKKKNLVGTMITGRKRADDGDTSDAVAAPIWRLILAVVIAAVVAWALWKGLWNILPVADSGDIY